MQGKAAGSCRICRRQITFAFILTAFRRADKSSCSYPTPFRAAVKKRYQKIFFDNYHGEPVIVFDNFNSDIPVEIFIGYFSNGYPLMLPAHGYPRTACYTDIYIISRHCINTQYYNRALYPSPDAQKLNSYIDTYIAFNLYSLSLEEITDPFNRENGI